MIRVTMLRAGRARATGLPVDDRDRRAERPDAESPRQPGVAADERGVSAVEFAFIAPILLLLCVAIFQFGTLMFAQNSMQHVAREASRRVAIGDMQTSQVAAWVGTQLPTWLTGSSTTVKAPAVADPEVRVTITAPMTKAAIVDPLGFFKGRTMNAEAAARAEWL